MRIQANGVNIELGSLGSGAFEESISAYQDRNIIIFVDENTHDTCLEVLLTQFEVLKNAEIILLPCGEENKVLEVCFQVWEALTEFTIHRNDLIINLGGGIVSDMGGFIASVYKRGVAFINIPTSLLGMVDAAIGGKTGIDFGPYKNLLGTFQNPKAVFIDPAFLETLPPEEIFNGFAEMIKHALIADQEHWDVLKKITNEQELTSIENISRSVEIKCSIVNQDPHESGPRKALNFGHTIGHGLEGYFISRSPISHGHAVALGLVAESYISMKRGWLSKTIYQEIEQVIIRSFPMIPIPEEGYDEIQKLILNDKKNEKNQVNCILLEAVGKVRLSETISSEELGSALLHLAILAQPGN